ncbi:hypothetical protein I5G58_gp060 [Mycobacterium phage BirdsNest]|uniref:DUF6378 domain-containing protein n=1 Tax=Mycobacterium phage BirdsNest TaxID=2686231 RepID=A0A6B9L6S7_9CAUD|nr:hypothetical protein I5G58_gp060 [Mycobacterium phage BirdsNest]QHB37362.1 hypothetical protein PBI_BIRDSNEST_60 [Mycobacterium phage BirdsNest]
MTNTKETDMPQGENIEGDRRAQIAADVEAVKRAADVQEGRCICEPHSPLIAPGCRARTHVLTDAAEVRHDPAAAQGRAIAEAEQRRVEREAIEEGWPGAPPKPGTVGTGPSPFSGDRFYDADDCTCLEWPTRPGEPKFDEFCPVHGTRVGVREPDGTLGSRTRDPIEAATGVPRPPRFVQDNMEAIERDLAIVAEPCPACAALPPHHTRNCPHYVAPVDNGWIGPRGGLRWAEGQHAVEVEVGPGELRPTGGYAADIAQHAIDLFTGDRNVDYGDATDNFQDIADLWSVVLRPILQPGAAITAEQVAIMSGLIKVARLNNSPHHDDSWVDATAYFALGGGIHRRRQAVDVGVDSPDAP